MPARKSTRARPPKATAKVPPPAPAPTTDRDQAAPSATVEVTRSRDAR